MTEQIQYWLVREQGEVWITDGADERDEIVFGPATYNACERELERLRGM